MTTLPKVIALLYECFTHVQDKKRKGFRHWLYRRMFMREAERSAEYLINNISEIIKEPDYNVVERHIHHGQKSVEVHDPTDGKFYFITMEVKLTVDKRP